MTNVIMAKLVIISCIAAILLLTDIVSTLWLSPKLSGKRWSWFVFLQLSQIFSADMFLIAAVMYFFDSIVVSLLLVICGGVLSYNWDRRLENQRRKNE